MLYKRIKDETKLIAKWKLLSAKPYYFHVFLWEDQESFEKNSLTGEFKSKDYAGSTNLAPFIIQVTSQGNQIIVKLKLGEVHFIKDKWDMEIVAHELTHVLIHRMRVLKPLAKDIIDQIEEGEEIICYEFGSWVDQVYRLLWEINPAPHNP